MDNKEYKTEYDWDRDHLIIDDSMLRSWIDMEYDANSIIHMAQLVDPSIKNNDLNSAYELILNEYDEHNDIDDFLMLNDYIEYCIEQEIV